MATAEPMIVSPRLGCIGREGHERCASINQYNGFAARWKLVLGLYI